MKNCTYYRPKTAEQAVGLLEAAWGTTELLAGGTDLLDLQKEYIAQPDKVVSLGGLAANFYVIDHKAGKDGTGLQIDAGIKLAEMVENSLVRKFFPALAIAAGHVARPQIPNMGTLCGNLDQPN